MELRDHAPSPLVQLEKKERTKIIHEAIQALPPEQREVIALRDIEGLSYEAIVQVTGLNPGTLKSRLAGQDWDSERG